MVALPEAAAEEPGTAALGESATVTFKLVRVPAAPPTPVLLKQLPTFAFAVQVNPGGKLFGVNVYGAPKPPAVTGTV